jgi:hypothetical protein
MSIFVPCKAKKSLKIRTEIRHWWRINFYLNQTREITLPNAQRRRNRGEVKVWREFRQNLFLHRLFMRIDHRYFAFQRNSCVYSDRSIVADKKLRQPTLLMSSFECQHKRLDLLLNYVKKIYFKIR